MIVDRGIDKNKLRVSFSSAANTYDGLARLQRKVALDLLTRFDMGNDLKTVLDIGCGTGFLTQQVLENAELEQMIAVDIATNMLQHSQNRLQGFDNVRYLCADAEYLALADKSIDTIVSNLALQWCQNLQDVLNGFKKSLRDDGRIFFSTFGVTTLTELKQAWSQVDVYPHVNEFYSTEEIHAFVSQAGFGHVEVEKRIYRSEYETVFELMRELKGIGAHNVLNGRNRKLTTKGSMQKMVEHYEKERVNGFIPATYEIIFVSAGKR